MNIKTPEQDRNEQLVRRLYHLAEAASKDTPKFVSLFADGGYFYDVAGGKKYYGSDIGLTVDIYAAAFPDMHRKLDSFYFYNNVVIVELSLNGTHKGDLAMPAGTIPATGREIHAPCCDVFHLEDGKVTSFHCYVAVPILLGQLARCAHESRGSVQTLIRDIRDVLQRVITRPRTGHRLLRHTSRCDCRPTPAPFFVVNY